MERDRDLREKIEEAIDIVLVRMIVEEVKKRMAIQDRVCLILLEEKAGAGKILSSLRPLAGDGRRFHILLPGVPFRWEERWEGLPGAEFYPLDSPKLPELLNQSDLVMLPAMSMTLAAKAAQCICDDPASAAFSKAIRAGKNILAAIDQAIPTEPTVPAAYLERSVHNLRDLMNYGVSVTAAAQLLIRAEELLQPELTVSKKMKQTEQPKENILHGRLIAKGAVEILPEGSTAILEEGARLTPLARDEIRKKRIQIRTRKR